jgi:hypothetical protein
MLWKPAALILAPRWLLLPLLAAASVLLLGAAENWGLLEWILAGGGLIAIVDSLSQRIRRWLKNHDEEITKTEREAEWKRKIESDVRGQVALKKQTVELKESVESEADKTRESIETVNRRAAEKATHDLAEKVARELAEKVSKQLGLRIEDQLKTLNISIDGRLGELLESVKEVAFNAGVKSEKEKQADPGEQ